MGKLNLLGRKITGIKAGQAVLNNLKKRFPPGHDHNPEHGHKHEQGHKSALRDQFLEIDVTGKELTDDGFEQFIDVLIECIKFGDAKDKSLARVTELRLQGNQLTVESLAKLAEVVALSTGDLRELDLSKNQLRIETAEDVEKWVAFLKAFEKCYLLKKLDLGSNPLGRLGIEHFARVYLKSDLQIVESDAATDVGVDNGEGSDVVEDMARMTVKENVPRSSKRSPNKGKKARPNSKGQTQIDPADKTKYACNQGLRSIPHLVLSEIGLSNTGALHLQSMLRKQETPENLLNFLPPGKSVALPQTASLCKSIIWRPTNDLPSYTMRLLEVAEDLPEMSDTKCKEQSLSDENDRTEENPSRGRNKGQDQGELPPNQIKDLKVEYTRLCKRVQLEAIKTEGVHSSTLWSTALRMMLISRAILLSGGQRSGSVGKVEGDEDEKENERENESEECKQEDEEEWCEEDDRSSDGPSFVHVEFVEPRVRSRVRFVEPGTGAYWYPGEDIAPMGPLATDTTPGEAEERSSPFYSGSEAFDSEFPTLQEAYEPSSVRASVPTEVRSSPRATPQSTRTRDKDLHEDGVGRFDLPFEVWRRTIAYAVGADGILDDDQQKRILKYAASWEALAQAQTFQGAEKHQQIWKLLQTLDCFNYSMQ
ncbi:hypothetical protein AbraIFM66951_008303 [Aspergillus brasiliensis]|uniref:Leucine rich repeat protein n=1 Tax=Aspergillus brasiliensis TaxID=319629 RepID=A0A9W5YX23_9EURO|nr:hypothetical protein AbraCBS73388_001001 [Aspergillus brasiliensis]GKZ45638.1 hypothetical protein AbraIFM66951_008303 [Aspergillus brasiliensis]